MPENSGIAVFIATSNQVVVVCVVGEAGITNSDEFGRQLLPVVAVKPRVVVFDIEELTFIASLGLSILMEFQRASVVRAAMCAF